MPGLVAGGAVVWLWGRVDGRWGDPIAEGGEGLQQALTQRGSGGAARRGGRQRPLPRLAGPPAEGLSGPRGEQRWVSPHAGRTCQFPVAADVERNGRHVMRQMRSARERGADLAHFPEACLSGYAGSDFDSYDGFDLALLEAVTRRVMELAAELGIWVVLGSTHRLTGDHKPHNSLYVIDGDGRIVDRYDKRFCSGDPGERTGDLAHYSPGDHSTVFTRQRESAAARRSATTTASPSCTGT